MKTQTFTSCLVIGLLSFVLVPWYSMAGTIAPDLEEALSIAAPDEEIAVIVSLADGADLKALKKGAKSLRREVMIKALKNKADETQGPLLASLIKKKAKKVKRFWIINGVAFQASAQTIHELSNLPGVASVRLDAKIQAPEPAAATSAIPEWNINIIRAPELWDLGYTGLGVVVANMDTGVDPAHQDIVSQWRGGSNSWFDPHGVHDTPHDANGHGTQTMGIMVGNDLGGTAIGVAPDAQWIAVKIYDDADLSTLSIIHQGFQWLLDPDGNPSTDDAPDVVNNSWGFETNAGECITEFQPDIEALKLMDIGVVFSGGNRGPALYSSVSPANNPGSFGVGAVDDTWTITYFSSHGPSACDGGDTYPTVVAPGANVRTADLTFNGSYPDAYTSVNGTSFAAPHVAGAMGLLLSYDPSLSVTSIESALVQSALDLGEVGPDNYYGNGLLDIRAALDIVTGGPVCTDSDGDDFFAEGGSCGIVDCDDSDVAINPDACDIKGDGIDQDCDGKDRTKGKPCPAATDPGGGDPGGDTNGTEGKGKTCSDGLDNDGDFLFDCDDPDCITNKKCR